MGALMIGSCKEEPSQKDLVCISVPNDTSKLGKKDHFIPVMSIDLFQKDFKGMRDSMARTYPDLFFPESETFNKKGIIDVLSLPHVVGLKFIYGVKPGKRKEFRVMIVGVDSAGNNVYLKRGSKMAAQEGQEDGGLEYGQCSPPCDVQKTQEPQELHAIA